MGTAGPGDLLARGIALLDDEMTEAGVLENAEGNMTGAGHRRILSDRTEIHEAIERLQKARFDMEDTQVVKDAAAIMADDPTPGAGVKLPPVPEEGETHGDCLLDEECKSERMYCVEEKCRCPVLFTGDTCETPRVPVEPWCLTPFKEWPARSVIGYTDLKTQRVHRFASCAVVGSSGEMQGSNKGPEIDAHSAIFRFNEAPAAPKFRGDVGSSTTLRFQNRDRSGFAEAKGEICVVRQGKWSKGQDSSGKCRFMQMPREVERYMDGHWKLYRTGEHWPASDPGRPWFSNGFAGIAFAMHMCARVDVYGFTFGTGYYFPKYKGPAKDWGRRGGFIRPPSKEMDKRHSWIRESSCLRTLAETYPSQVTLQSSKLTKAQ